MDERIRQEYHRIYSEMYVIILGICAISLVTKIMCFEKSLSDCWLEYLILVGSPVYRFVRCRMLNVAVSVEIGQKKWKVRLFSMLFAISVLYLVMMYIRTGKIAVVEFMMFMIPFIAVFLVVTALTFFIQKRWQKKMEDKYKE